jgi:hypothetical protein
MKVLKIIVCSLLVLIGFWIGFIAKHLPYIKWNREVKVYEIFQVIATLFIGIAIPFFIKKWIDDGRAIKTLLVDEAKEIILEAKKIKEVLTDCYQKGYIDSNQKQYILYLLSQLESLLQNYGDNLQSQFGNRSVADFNLLVDAYNICSNKLTQDEFMTDNFNSVTLEFLNSNNLELNILLGEIRALSVKMQKL